MIIKSFLFKLPNFLSKFNLFLLIVHFSSDENGRDNATNRGKKIKATIL